MTRYEYRVVAATNRGQKAKGLKTAEARFAHALEGQINAEAAEGWEYLRAEMLPSVERSGLTGSTTEWRHMLVFRRAVEAPMADLDPELLPPPAAEEPDADWDDKTIVDKSEEDDTPKP